MKYMLLICHDESYDPADPPAEVRAAGPAWAQEMQDRGVRLSGSRVRPASDATTVRVRGDEVVVSDGPYAETREQMAGYDLIECADLDEAIAVAASHPMAAAGMVEVRPLWP